MSVDICIVTTLRPKILEKTLLSFFENITCNEQMRVIYNIDMVPIKEGLNYNMFSIGHILGTVSQMLRQSSRGTINIKPNFANAVKTVWKNSTSDYVFHLEDDWTFLRKINLEKCIIRMTEENFDYMRFPKENAPHLNCLHKVALQPSLWKGDVVRNLAKHMTIDKDPEKQLRTGQGNEELDKILIELQNKGLKDYCSEWCCKDIGREWREERGLVKWNAVEPNKVSKNNQNAKNITWDTK